MTLFVVVEVFFQFFFFFSHHVHLDLIIYVATSQTTNLLIGRLLLCFLSYIINTQTTLLQFCPLFSCNTEMINIDQKILKFTLLVPNTSFTLNKF